MRPGWAMAPRFVRQNETEIVCQNERIEGIAGLRAAKYVCDLRSDQGFVALPRPVSGARTWRSSHLQHVQGSTEMQYVRGLEPARRTQNDDLRLFPSCQGRTDSFNSRQMG